MARPRQTRTSRPAPAPAPQDQVEDQVDEDADEETSSAIRPTDLATELEVSPKALRAFLRREFPRDPAEKNTSWNLNQEQVDAATAHFLGTGEEEAEEVEEEAAPASA